MKILIVGPSWVGDMVMSQSLYSVLMQLNNEASIDVLAPAWCRPILDRMPEVRKAIEMPVGHGSFDVQTRWKLGRQLAKEQYTHSFILPNSAKSALVPLFANIKHRTGWKGEFRYGLLNDLRPDKKVFQYMVERYVALAYSKQEVRDLVSLEACPKPNLKIDQANLTETSISLSLNLKVPTIGICPGAEFGPAKRWPEEHYAKVAEHAIKRHGQQVWLFGSQNDVTVCEAIRALLPRELQSKCFNLSGKTELVDAVDLLSACHTVITNDSGLMHVSAAVGCNIIAIYGSSSPDYTPPLSQHVEIVTQDIECRPCFKRECPLGHLECLTKLNTSKVIQALNGFIDKNNEIPLV